jgi:hypothetical protein
MDFLSSSNSANVVQSPGNIIKSKQDNGLIMRMFRGIGYFLVIVQRWLSLMTTENPFKKKFNYQI